LSKLTDIDQNAGICLTQVRGYDVRTSISKEAGNRHSRGILSDIKSELCGECAVAGVGQHNCDAAAGADCNHVQLAILVKIGKRDRRHIHSKRVAGLVRERAIAGVHQHRNRLTVCNHQVRPAVAIQVADRNVDRQRHAQSRRGG